MFFFGQRCHSCLLEYHHCLLWLKQIMVQTENVTSWPVSTPACLSVDSMLILYSLWVLLNSYTLWIHWNSMLMGHHQSYMRGGGKSGRSASGTHACSIVVPSDFTIKHNSEIKLLRIWRWWQWSFKPGIGLSEHEAQCDCIGHMPMKSVLNKRIGEK